jgi:hypothetical protein
VKQASILPVCNGRVDMTLEGFKLSLELFTLRHLGEGFAAFHG